MTETNERLLSFDESLADYKKEMAAQRGDVKDDHTTAIFKHPELRNAGASKHLPRGKTTL
jgi:hypothetical protein